MSILLRDGGLPYATENAASMAAGRKGVGKYTIVPYGEGDASGFAINVEGENQVNTSAQETNSKAPTESKEKVKHKVTAPWSPARVLDIPERFKDPNFRYRWCDKNKPGNIQKKLSEGWEIDKEISRKLTAIANKTVDDGSPLDGTAQVRELVVMRMPVELAESRAEYYKKRSEMATRDAENDLKRKTGGQAYGKITEERN